MQKKYMGNFGGTSIIKDQSLLNHEAIKQQIIILDELRDLIPPLQQEESDQLERNILAEGCREALLIWQTTANILDTNSTETSAVYILVDGHNRYGICLKHKLNFKIHLISFDSLKEVRDYMIDNQLGRRNLIPEQASYLRGLRYNTEKLEKGKYTREDHKGQNVPYDLKGNESTEKVKEIPAVRKLGQQSCKPTDLGILRKNQNCISPSYCHIVDALSSRPPVTTRFYLYHSRSQTLSYSISTAHQGQEHFPKILDGSSLATIVCTSTDIYY